MGLLISFAYLLLYIAVIVLVAFALKWLFEWFTETTIEPNVYKWCKVVVGLLIIIAVLVWISGALGTFHFRFGEALGISSSWASTSTTVDL